MSISSMAEDATLRLAPRGEVVPTAASVAAVAAATAAAAAASGTNPATAAQEGRDAAQAVKASGGDEPRAEPSPLSTLVKYIPTETITLYVAIQGALGEITPPTGDDVSETDFSSRWAWMWIMLGVTLILTAGLCYRGQKNVTAARFRFPIFEVLASGIAFLVWALSLPSTPLRDLSDYDYSAWNSVIILAGTVIIATAAYVLGKTVSWEKVVEV